MRRYTCATFLPDGFRVSLHGVRRVVSVRGEI